LALAPGHRLGQIIGDTLELAVEPPLATFAEEHRLYLDRHGDRPARKGKKVTWEDDLGNSHNLDYVLERGGAATRIGVPAAFIEIAWRRYTKHSRNKAQEIQGAVLPLLTTYAHAKPFAGVILAGVFTDASLRQLRSSGFEVLHVTYEKVTQAFGASGLDIAYDEGTPDDDLRAQIDIYDGLDESDRRELGANLREAIRPELDKFIGELAVCVLRRIDFVSVLALHGEAHEFGSIQGAVGSFLTYSPPEATGPPVRFELTIRYDNGDEVVADFADPADAVAFLESFTD
jgi:hypothetical protein